MADLNALIAQGYKFQAPPDPFAQYAKMQQLDQGEQANQLNRMKMQEYQRGMEETNALRRLDPASATYLEDIKRINPKTGFEFAKLQQEAKTAGIEGQIKSIELLTKELAMLPDAYRIADTPEAYLQLHESIHANPVVGPYLKSIGATPDKGRAAIQNAVETGTFDKLRLGSMRNVSQIIESLKPIVAAPSASVYDPTTGTFKQAPAAPAAAAVPKLHVVNGNLVRDDGTVVFTAPKSAGDGAGVAKAPSGYRVTATGDLEAIPGGPAAGKPMTDLQKQAYRKDFANDTSNIKSASDTANELEKLTDELVGNPDKGIKAHPGLRGITGYSGLVPSLPTGDAAKAEQKLETFKGKIKALGRTIASQQGKLGNMAVQEWQMVSDAVQAIKPTAGNLDVQMRDVVRQAQQLSKNMQDKFDLTYEGDLPAVGKPAPAAGAGGALSPAEQAELAQLRKRFGK